jgi:hypothetical protein
MRMKRNASGLVITKIETMLTTTSIAASSALRCHERKGGSCGGSLRLRRKGANTRMPIASPVHQINQVTQRSFEEIWPAISSVAAPIEALTSMLSSAARKTIATASRSRSSSSLNPTRSRSVAARSGARVFPPAIARDASGSTPIETFTANAANATPGQTRRPKMRKATKAMPVGGQKGVTPVTKASRSPRRAATKYATATRNHVSAHRIPCVLPDPASGLFLARSPTSIPPAQNSALVALI